jgi:hypothetical protein
MDMAASIDEVCLMNLARWRIKNRIGTALRDFGGKLLEEAYGRLEYDRKMVLRRQQTMD